MFQYFYHQRLRKAVAIFGTMFNNIHVLRQNASGKTISQVKVPLSYAPKDKYLERIRNNPDLDNNQQVALKLPRMSFEIIALSYNPERKIPKLNNYNNVFKDDRKNKFFTPAPYDINMQLNIFAKQQDDALQIVEQILPYFNPQYTLTIKPFTELAPELREDVPISIQGVTFTDDYEGAVADRRTIIYTLDFLMHVNFYGPITQSDIIRKATIDMFEMDQATIVDDKLQQYILTGDSHGISLDSAEVSFGFIKTIHEEFEPDSDRNPSRFIANPLKPFYKYDSIGQPYISYDSALTIMDSDTIKIMRYYGYDNEIKYPMSADSQIDSDLTSMIARITDRQFQSNEFIDSSLSTDLDNIIDKMSYFRGNYLVSYDNVVIEYNVDSENTDGLVDILNRYDSYNLLPSIVNRVGDILQFTDYDSTQIVHPITVSLLDSDSDGILFN